jgi:hypothetical protein
MVPTKSGKQYRFMQAVAHGSVTGGSSGPSRSVAKEFVEKTPAKKRRMFSKELRKKGKK